MLIVAVVLLALATALAVGVLTDGASPVDVEVFGTGLEGFTVGELFLLGLGTGAVAVASFGLLLGSLARRRSRRRAAKREVKEVRTERETLAEENARLQDELEQARTEQQRADLQRAEQARQARDASTYPTDPADGAVREDVELPAPGRGRHAR